MALLGRHLAYDFPILSLFSTASFGFNRRVYNSHDICLKVLQAPDGIKTGYTRASGFNLVTSVVRNNKHVIGVVMGGISPPATTERWSTSCCRLRAFRYRSDSACRRESPVARRQGAWNRSLQELPAATPGDTNVLVAAADADPNTTQTAIAPDVPAPPPVAASIPR